MRNRASIYGFTVCPSCSSRQVLLPWQSRKKVFCRSCQKVYDFDESSGIRAQDRIELFVRLAAIVLIAAIIVLAATFFLFQRINRAEPKDNGWVYVMPGNTVYHRQTCRELHGQTGAMRIEGAQAYGYTPCPVCKPPDTPPPITAVPEGGAVPK